MEGSSECEFLSAQSVAVAVSATASSSSHDESAEDESMMESESLSRSMVQERIEASKQDWSELSDGDRSLSWEEVAAENREAFKTLKSHPEWGRLFGLFNDNSLAGNKLVVGEKFAEGGQAELFYAHVTWGDPLELQYDLDCNIEYVLKVFKKGTLLQHLQEQWPHGFLKWERDGYHRRDNHQHLLTPSRLYYSSPTCGLLLEDGRFAFLMEMRKEDLQTLIKSRMYGEEAQLGPFPENESDTIMYKISLGVLWLHEHDVVHRDLKAANVLVAKNRSVYVADYECSIGVVGTGYWRAPEILQACKEGIVRQKEELFSKPSDVYSYAMTCYEILTGKSPFEGEMVTMESVIGGQRPKLPTFIIDWAQQFLRRCWDTNPSARPSIQEILTIIAANTDVQWIKDVDVEQKRIKVTDVEVEHLGCDNHLHAFTQLESGNFKCKLCFETCNKSMMKCTTCTDYYLHLECAIPRSDFSSPIHPHGLRIYNSYVPYDSYELYEKTVCGGCQLDIGRMKSWYTCHIAECDFNLHLLCAKYVGRISHPLYKDHKLVLSSSSSSTSLRDSGITCECCKVQFNPMEFIYHCEECAFNIHPKCAIPLVQVHRH